MIAYKYLTATTVAKIDNDGVSRSSCSIDNPDYLTWLADGNTTLPADPIDTTPKTVTMRQARLALLAAGKLSDITTAIAALPSPDKESAEITWEYSQEVHRNNSFVTMLGSAIGLTDTDIDNLFITAATL